MPSDQTRSSTISHLRRSAAVVVAGFIAWRLLATLVESWAFTTDDAFITLEYARSLVDGHGLRWIAEQPPIEGYSNFSYVLIAAAGMAAGLDPVWLLKAVGVASLFGTCSLVFLLARRWSKPLGALIPVALLLTQTGTTYWVASGLETSLFQFLALLALWLFIGGCEQAGFGISESPSPRRAPLTRRLRSRTLFGLSAVIAFAASLTRLEGPVIGAVLIGLLAAYWVYGWLAPSDSKPEPHEPKKLQHALTLLVGLFVVPTTAYVGWRLAYFGELLPNTYYCKTDVDYDPFRLLSNYWRQLWPYALAALFFPWRKADLRTAALAALPVLYTVLLYDADTEVAHHLRLFMPAFAPLCVLAGVALSFRIGRVIDDTGKYKPVAVALTIAVSLALWEFNNVRIRSTIENAASQYSLRVDAREQLASWLNRHVGPEGSVAVGDVGVVGYRTDADIIDLYCLNSHEFTSDEIDRDPEKFVEWIFSTSPDAIVVTSASRQEMDPHGPFSMSERLMKRISARDDYRLAQKFGQPPDRFIYWVYVRSNSSE